MATAKGRMDRAGPTTAERRMATDRKRGRQGGRPSLIDIFCTADVRDPRVLARRVRDELVEFEHRAGRRIGKREYKTAALATAIDLRVHDRDLARVRGDVAGVENISGDLRRLYTALDPTRNVLEQELADAARPPPPPACRPAPATGAGCCPSLAHR